MLPPTRVTGIALLCSAALIAQARGEALLPTRINPRPGTDRCTTMAVGSKATVDGSVMTTHTADCAECDFRLAKVPARDWPPGSERPVYLFSSAYPRRVQRGRSATWDPENLEDLPQRAHWDESWSKIIGYIPQVNHTYALLEGLYGIMNEHQVAIGESTCSGRFWTKPVSQGGKALFEISELSSVALERCKTARCAIQTMGDLATTYGYYGAQWDGSMDDIIAEAGEALTVADAKEAWIFHIIPDHTGTSAIWAAQRVPDDHISLVANQFVIRGVVKGHPDFMYSDNLWAAALHNKLWSPQDGELDFLKVYGYLKVHSSYATRRVWRVFTLAAPSSALPSETNDYGDDYPFSIKPEYAISAKTLMRYQRDHYEGTPYDLTQGVGAGPYGDPNRYDPAARPQDGVTPALASQGIYERSISLFRTSYSTVTQSRDSLPPFVGARLWVCQYMPAMSTYTPIYLSASDLPRSYTVGSLFKYTKAASYWASASVGNWASRFYRFIRLDVEAKQRDLEEPLTHASTRAESAALALLALGRVEDAAAVLQDFADHSARTALDTWNELFEVLIAKYRDGYRVTDLTAPLFQQEFLFYPLWWLKLSGFFRNALSLDSSAHRQPDLAVLAETGELDRLLDSASSSQPPASSSMDVVGVSLLVAGMSALSAALGFLAAKGYYSRRQQYLSINV